MYEPVFSLCGLLSLLGWVALLVSPRLPDLSDRIAGLAVPTLLALIYVGVAILAPGEAGDFNSFAGITRLFASPGPLLAGWIHFLAFDLVAGAWICRTGRAEGIGFRWVLPCLPLTFLLGPAGFLAFGAVRLLHGRPRSAQLAN